MSIFSTRPSSNALVVTHPSLPLLVGMEFVQRNSPMKDELEELARFHQQNDWVFDLRCTEPYLHEKRRAIIVTDALQCINWASRGFVRMTGYSYCEAYNRKPTFLQGPKTALSTRLKIRESLENRRVFEGSIINYRKSGNLYTCHVTIMPILNTQGQLVNFIALEEAR